MDILDIAKRECKGDVTPEEAAWLRSNDRRNEWYRALGVALNEFESQMSYHRTRIDRMADDTKAGIVSKAQYIEESERFENWHRKASRYRSGIVSRMSEVKALIDSDPTSDFKSKYVDLLQAINRHRLASESLGLTPESHDIELWDSINK